METILECYTPMISAKPLDEDLEFVEKFIDGDELAFFPPVTGG